MLVCLTLNTYNFVVDNKQLKRKMWTKVVESGHGNRGRGQDWKTERRQWNLKLGPPQTALTNRNRPAF